MHDQVTAISVSDTVSVEPATGRGHAAWAYLIAVACLALVVVSQVAKPHVGHRALWIVCAVVILCWVAAGFATLPRAPRISWLVMAGSLCASIAAA